MNRVSRRRSRAQRTRLGGGAGRGRRPAVVAVLGLGAALLAAGCSGSAAAPATPGAGPGSGPVAVVTSTNVWGSVVRTVGGDRVTVTSLIASPNADPHSYEATAQDQLALSKATLVVENGGGYDDFVDTMLTAAGTSATVINAVTVSGLASPPASSSGSAAGAETAPNSAAAPSKPGELNEHVWYDFPTVAAVADRIAQELGRADPADASAFAARATTFKAALTGLEAKESAIKAASAGAGVAITEPVPLYLLQASGLVDRTPEQFSRAVEDGSDVPPAVLRSTLDLFDQHAVRLLVYNEQTTNGQTDQILAAAKRNGIPAVGVTETLPAGKDYLSWMTANVDAVAAALAAG